MLTYPLSVNQGVILVNIKVIGPKTESFVRVMLDTGATYTMLSPETLMEIGYHPSQTSTKHLITTASGVELCSFIHIKALSALGHTMKNIQVYAHSLPPNLPAEGLLGLNFLRHFNLHLRFLDQVLEISK